MSVRLRGRHSVRTEVPGERVAVWDWATGAWDFRHAPVLTRFLDVGALRGVEAKPRDWGGLCPASVSYGPPSFPARWWMWREKAVLVLSARLDVERDGRGLWNLRAEAFFQEKEEQRFGNGPGEWGGENGPSGPWVQWEWRVERFPWRATGKQSDWSLSKEGREWSHWSHFESSGAGLPRGYF